MKLVRFSRLLLSSLAIMFGVAFVTGTMVLGDALQLSLEDKFARVARNVDAVVEQGYTPARLDPAAVAAVDGVASIDVRQSASVPLLGANGRADEAALVTLAADASLRPQNVVRGGFPSAGQVAVSEQTARDRKLEVGAEVTLIDFGGKPTQFTVSGVYQSGGAQRPGAAEVLVGDATPFLDPAAPASDAHVVVRADPGVDQSVLVERLRAALPKELDVLTGEQYTVAQLQRFGGGDDVRTAMLLFSVVSLVVAAMVIMNTFTILIAQRTRELGLLRSIGASRGQIFRGVLTEAFVTGLIAAVLGLGAGIGLAAVLQQVLSDDPVRLPVGAGTVVVAFAVGVLVTLLAAVPPARRATRVSPMEVLRTQQDSREEVARTSRGRIVAIAVQSALGVLLAVVAVAFNDGPKTGMALAVAAGLVLLGAVVTAGPLIVGPVIGALGAPLPGMPAALAGGNARRNPKRTAATMAALLVGVAVVTMFTVVANSVKTTQQQSLEQRLPADFTLESSVPDRLLPAALTDRIAVRPEVASAGAQASAGIALQAGGEETKLRLGGVSATALGTLTRPEIARGDLSSVRGDAIAVSTYVAQALDVDLGATVIARTFSWDNGTYGSPRTFTVAAVLKPGPGEEAIVELEAFRTLTAVSGVDSVLVKLKDGVSADAGRTAVEQASADVPTARAISQVDTKNAFNAEVDDVLTFVWAMIGLAVLIALFGIANTLTLSVLERTRESALLRALGFTRGQLRRMLVVESILIALTGAVLGVVLGGLCAGLLITAMSREQNELVVSVPFGQLGVLLLAAGVAAVLAAVLPARRAAGASIVSGMADR